MMTTMVALALLGSTAHATCASTCDGWDSVWSLDTPDCENDWWADGCACDCITDETGLVAGTVCADVGTPTTDDTATPTLGETGDTGAPAVACVYRTEECISWGGCGGGSYDYDYSTGDTSERPGSSSDDDKDGWTCSTGGAAGAGSALWALAGVLGLWRRR